MNRTSTGRTTWYNYEYISSTTTATKNTRIKEVPAETFGTTPNALHTYAHGLSTPQEGRPKVRIQPMPVDLFASKIEKEKNCQYLMAKAPP